MLDYEILSYKVQYLIDGAPNSSDRLFETEESAIEFIKDNRSKWKCYRLVKCQMAIIDF